MADSNRKKFDKLFCIRGFLSMTVINTLNVLIMNVSFKHTDMCKSLKVFHFKRANWKKLLHLHFCMWCNILLLINKNLWLNKYCLRSFIKLVKMAWFTFGLIICYASKIRFRVYVRTLLVIRNVMFECHVMNVVGSNACWEREQSI